MAYSFPNLPVPEILNNLHTIGFTNLTDDDILKPQADNLRKVYERLLAALIGYRREDNQQIKFSAMNMLANPELHEESIDEIKFIRTMTKFMRSIGVVDFGTKDIYRPEHPRVKKTLSAIINFALFSDYKAAKLQELQLRNDELRVERDQILNDTNIIHNQLNDLRTKKFEQDAIEHELNTEIQQHQHQLYELNLRQAELRAQCEESQSMDESVSNKIENTIFLIQTVNQEISTVESMVVRSPERVKREIEDKENQLRLERENIVKLESQISRLQQTYNTSEKITKDMDKTLTLIEQASKEYDNYKKIKQLNKDAQKKISDQQKVLKELDSKLKTAQKTMTGENDAMRNNQERFRKNKDQCDRSYQEAESEHQLLKREMGENAEKCLEINREIQTITCKLEEEIRTNELVKREIVDHYTTLVESIHFFHQQINSNLQDPPQRMVE